MYRFLPLPLRIYGDSKEGSMDYIAEVWNRKTLAWNELIRSQAKSKVIATEKHFHDKGLKTRIRTSMSDGVANG